MSFDLIGTIIDRSNNYIDGQWRPAAHRFDVVDPATGAALSSVPDSGKADAQAALDAAAAALPAWRALPAKVRAQHLKRWHALVIAHLDELAQLISREQGKVTAEARAEVIYGAAYIEWFAEEAVRSYGDIIPGPAVGKKMMVVKEAVGVVAAITPWNFPIAMIARKLAPALAAGCTVVAKPAEDTPLSALALARLAHEAGIPAGVLNVVTASRAQAAQVVDVWLDDARVRKISFTGSTDVGKHLARQSAATLKRLSLELGGNAPFMVFEDADLDAAVDGLMAAKFRNGGQTCVSPNRIYVHAAVYERFSELLVRRVSALKVGPASDPAAQVGPMINARAVDKITRHIADACARGAKVLTGGKPLHVEGSGGTTFFAPTVLAEADHTMLLAHEETFGPVAALFRFENEEQAMRLANETPFGLAAYFYTRDLARIWRISERFESGMVGINEGAISSEAAPFGGIKDSGYGREGSRYGLDDYMQTKYLCMGGLA
ncbi:NAD-dependent succinate-semialdehyde dehydrogenase [Massilia terrae]|uniref:NAD-dependent succinate-semialdehyde dehydrogenase n=1 Tax=Massilia terrae TaxID=1811224 RepID=A0ABT2CYC9_9BURK|nr:NAD-dependent succinate-semialdehyde dehydrogenase [Massilia terrae]MCS0658980.1 NAD-dependent succinate-semialdehyde dehydrogenase [Massilia terrae]